MSKSRVTSKAPKGKVPKFYPITIELTTPEEAIVALALLNVPLANAKEFVEKSGCHVRWDHIEKGDAGYQIWCELSDELARQGFYDETVAD